MPSPFRRLIPALLHCLLAAPVLLAALPAAAIDQDDLLPVDEAFVLTASAPSRDRIDVRWKIADGYYLYRHRTAVTASGGFSGGTLRLPDGTRHTDEFFGPVDAAAGNATCRRRVCGG